jgi:2-oxoglutarate dehydrogenase complex dehydrogenase (E1) component-like enzyme
MYEAWRKDPKSVHVSWRTFFENEEAGLGKGTSGAMPVEQARLLSAVAR